MTKLQWTFGAAVLILLVANLASTWYTHSQDDQRFNAQVRTITDSAIATRTSVARSITAIERTTATRLDRNWRMTIAARKAACEAFTAATTLPHYLYPSTCDEADIRPAQLLHPVLAATGGVQRGQLTSLEYPKSTSETLGVQPPRGAPADTPCGLPAFPIHDAVFPAVIWAVMSPESPCVPPDSASSARHEAQYIGPPYYTLPASPCPVRCARCRHRSEQCRVSRRTATNPTPHSLHARPKPRDDSPAPGAPMLVTGFVDGMRNLSRHA